MAGETIQLINSAAQVSSDAFNRIDRAMSQQIETTQRAGEFAVQMTAKTADAIEQARMHDATIEKMQIDSKLRGEEVAIERSLMPLKAQSYMLQMQAEKARIEKYTRENDLQNANAIFSTYNDLAGREILATGNPQHAQDYLRYRAQWQSHLLNGGKFDAGKFEQGLNTINSKYAGQKMPEGSDWNAETQNLYNAISPQLGKAYEMRNPVVKKNIGALAMTSLTMSNNDFTDFGTKIGGQVFGDQFGTLAIGRMQYQDNEKTIEKLRSRNQQLMNVQYSDQVSEEEKAAARKELEANNNTITTAERTNNLIRANYAQNKYGTPEAYSGPTQEKPENKQGKQDLYSNPEPKPRLGYKAENEMDLKGAKVLNRLADIASIAVDSKKGKDEKPISDESTEFQLLDLNWWAGNHRDEEPNDKTKIDIRDRIQKGVDAVGSVGEVVTENKIRKLFEKLDKSKITEVPLSDFTAEQLGMDKPTQGFISAPGGNYKTEPQKQVIYFGAKSQFSSAEDIAKHVDKVKDKGMRQEVLKELYAALATATISQALNTSK